MNDRIREFADEADNFADNKIQMPGEYHPDWHDIRDQKFAELIIQECISCCGAQADKKNIRKRFGLPVESSVQYEAPPIHGSVTSQYTREYNIPRDGIKSIEKE